MARKHSDSLTRRAASRQPTRKFVLFCEGKLTEPSYFAFFKRIRGANVIIETMPERGVPLTLVESARAYKREKEAELEPGDEIWIVCDVDEHPKLKQALDQARRDEISVALSNPCFELWLVLHFCDHSKQIERGKVQSTCKKHLKRYDKELNEGHLRQLADQYERAYQRAVRLQRGVEERDSGNPSTRVHLLTENILKAIHEFRDPESPAAHDDITEALERMLVAAAARRQEPVVATRRQKPRR